MDKRIIDQAEKCGFSGVVGFSKNGQPYDIHAFGLRNNRDSLPNTQNTLFGIASGTKTFTAATVLVLAAGRDINLNQTVESIMGPGEYVDSVATIHQLLTHTSGIFDYYDEELVEDFDNYEVSILWSKLETPSDYLPLFQGEKMKFRAGERYSYSNGGYIMLGIIIEKVTGRRFRDVVKELVLDRAGMKDSGFYDFCDLPANTADGYFSGADGRLVSNIYQLPRRGASDGGMYTNFTDIARFWKAYTAGRVIPMELYGKAVMPHARVSPNHEYGYGIYLGNVGEKPVHRMIGGDVGVGFDSFYFPENDGFICTLLSNRTDGNSGLVPLLVQLIAEQFV